MRRTKKYKKALQFAREKGIDVPRRIDNAHLYEKLQKRGFWWSSRESTWNDTPQPSNSVFAETVQGNEPSGVVKIRVMAHPDEVDEFVRRVQQAPGVKIFEVSNHYQNRKGVGVRVYLTGLKQEMTS
jgi:hypothetical protein